MGHNLFVKKVVVTVILLLSTAIHPANGEIPKSSFKAPNATQVKYGHWQYTFTPTPRLPLSWKVQDYKNTEGDMNLSAVLPVCNGNQTACIKTVEYSVAGSDWIAADAREDQGQREYAFGILGPQGGWIDRSTSTFPEDLGKNQPEGSTARLWTFNKAPHVGGTDYEVSATFKGSKLSNNRYDLSEFRVQILPMTRVLNVDRANCPSPSTLIPLVKFSSNGICQTDYDFPKDLKIRITLTMGSFLSSVRGWFDGRMRDAEISISRTSRELVIQGSPIMVSSAASKQIKYEDIPNDWFFKPDARSIAEQNKSPYGTSIAGDANLGAIENFLAMEKYILESAIGENSVWNISSMPDLGGTKCIQSGNVNGLVLTNATVYDPKAPQWNPSNASLNFRVASPHLDSQGSTIKGYYKMIINEQTAKCYWGQNFSQGTASISVVNQDGSPNIATTNLGKKYGWVNFEAVGFTFSSPTIVTKISTKPKRKSTILCTANQKSIKVIGVNPQCPKGFKKR